MVIKFKQAINKMGARVFTFALFCFVTGGAFLVLEGPTSFNLYLCFGGLIAILVGLWEDTPGVSRMGSFMFAVCLIGFFGSMSLIIMRGVEIFTAILLGLSILVLILGLWPQKSE